MIEVEINGDKLAQAGIGFKQTGETAVLKKADITARCQVKEGKLLLFPDRSSAHKAILAALG